MYPLRIYVWDAIRHGLKISLAHINRSEAEWSVRSKTIVAGLNIVKGLSYNSMDRIICERNIRPFTDLSDLRVRTKLTRPELQSLIHTGACDGLGNSRPAMLMQLHFTPVEPGQLTLFELLPNPPVRQLPDYDRVTRLRAEVDTTGIPFTMHPELLVHKRHILANELARFVNREVTVAGFLATARRAKTTDGKVMGFATLEDSSGLAEISFFRDQIDQYESLCSTAGPVWVRGKVTEHMATLSVQCQTSGTAA
jgi:DNA polymerase III alpha subunit